MGHGCEISRLSLGFFGPPPPLHSKSNQETTTSPKARQPQPPLSAGVKSIVPQGEAGLAWVGVLVDGESAQELASATSEKSKTVDPVHVATPPLNSKSDHKKSFPLPMPRQPQPPLGAFFESIVPPGKAGLAVGWCSCCWESEPAPATLESKTVDPVHVTTPSLKFPPLGVQSQKPTTPSKPRPRLSMLVKVDCAAERSWTGVGGGFLVDEKSAQEPTPPPPTPKPPLWGTGVKSGSDRGSVVCLWDFLL